MLGADYQTGTGAGIGGRITTDDIELAHHTGPEEVQTQGTDIVQASGCDEVKLSRVRKVIANSMKSSLALGAQLTLHSSFDASDVFAFRKNIKLKQGFDGAAGITITDVLTYATSRVLLKHKSMNAHFLDDKMLLFHDAHIGIACDTPRGLLVPTVFHANKLTLAELSAQAKGLFEECRQGTVKPDALKGGTFTISNLGGFGIEMFTPIINPPQTGLLGVCSVIERTKDGRSYPAMGLSLTFDHRALDGADAARFLKDLVDYLEKFSVFLAIEGGLV